MSEWQVEPTVMHDITVECRDQAGRHGYAEAGLGYLPTDPFAVTVTFRTAAESVPWTFSRDLLEAGTTEPSGRGDVRVSPSLDAAGVAVTVLELSSPDGTFRAQARTSQVQAFLSRTFELVPHGHESARLDLGALVTRLLAD